MIQALTIEELKKKAHWVRVETLKIHKVAPSTRVASSLSPVELLTVLHYGGILDFDPKDPRWPGRDRLILSKGHGTVCMYPILADLGYFSLSELQKVCQEGSFLGGIPDPIIPGFETANGSLGHGLGVACGIALALKRLQKPQTVFVLLGDGELFEGSIWEAVMFAVEHDLDNLVAIIDDNKISMLDYCRNIVDIAPYGEKFAAFGWETADIDGHDVEALMKELPRLKKSVKGKPRLLVSHTLKGKGVPSLERDAMCHLAVMKPEAVDAAIEALDE